MADMVYVTQASLQCKFFINVTDHPICFNAPVLLTAQDSTTIYNFIFALCPECRSADEGYL